MTLKTLIASVGVATILPTLTMADSPDTKTFVLEAPQNTLLAGNADAVDQYFATDYIQHNPTIADGIDGQKSLIGYMSSVEEFSADYVRVIADTEGKTIHV